MNKPVSHTLAQLLLEKGFSWETGDDDDYEKGRHGYFKHHKSGRIEALSYFYFDTNHNAVQWINLNIPAPTISDVVMWLYKKYGIWISVDGGINGFYGHYKITPIGTLPSNLKQGWTNTEESPFNSPTEAYEGAIEYLLTKYDLI